tara:strand:- start:945 stop:1664 length:720 start_codon:yes stop_codon:yes gene_type:complete
MDHPIAYGPIDGLVNMSKAVDNAAIAGANAVVLHAGSVFSGHRQSGKDMGLILHLNASTNLSPNPNTKVMVNTVQHALKLGADAVSMQLNIGANDEAKMLNDVAMVALECREWGLPLLVMVYPKGGVEGEGQNPEVIKHIVRASAEIGADIVKTGYTGSIDSFKQVVEGCPVPVIVAGGSKGDEMETLKMIEDSIKAGGSGVAMGRNSFQHKDPTKFMKAVSKVVQEGKTAEEAAKDLK